MIDLKTTKLNFLDLETTGTSYLKDRVIEIHIDKVFDGEVINTFHTLVNPKFKPDDFILSFTNISFNELSASPEFEEIHEELYEFLKEGVIVAHNARFDYGFLKAEFERYGFVFKPDYCCTVQLSRNLYPHHKKHSLDHIISRFNLDSGNRHRAEYDTEVIRNFFYLSKENFGEEKFQEAFHKSLKSKAIPPKLKASEIENIPEKSGVYIFYGENKIPLYVGMSKNLKRRVKDHLHGDLNYIKDFKINRQLKNIEIIVTAGELGAMLRESALIKKLEPVYNQMLRRNSAIVKLTREYDEKGYSTVIMQRDANIYPEDIKNLIGVFPNERGTKDLLHSYVKEFGLCSKLLGLEKTNGRCFASQLGQCKGACAGTISFDGYNKLFDEVFARHKIQDWPYEGPINIVEESENLRESFTFNKWCFLESDKWEIDGLEADKNIINLDTYKILKRYLSSK